MSPLWPLKNHYSIHFHDENYIVKLKEALPVRTFGRKCINVKYRDERTIYVVKQSVKEKYLPDQQMFYGFYKLNFRGHRPPSNFRYHFIRLS